jgi:hypothetical protein
MAVLLDTVLDSRRRRSRDDRCVAGDQIVAALILKRAAASRPSGEWNDDDYDVLADGIAVGRIMNAAAALVGSSWL